MRLTIHDNFSIEDIQDHFTECFPNLKIEFYDEPHHWKKGSAEGHLLDPKRKIGDIRKIHNQGVLDIKSWDTAGKIESELKRLYGLNVQIFRLQKGSWLQTLQTDTYTLKELSELQPG